jgi:hypothetical protein
MNLPTWFDELFETAAEDESWVEEIPPRTSELEENSLGELHDIPADELEWHRPSTWCVCKPTRELAAYDQVIWMHYQAEKKEPE